MNGHRLQILKDLSKENNLSQRVLSRKLGLSLGSVNYVLSSLVEAGLIKAKRFFTLVNKTEDFKLLYKLFNRVYPLSSLRLSVRKNQDSRPVTCFLLYITLHSNNKILLTKGGCK